MQTVSRAILFLCLACSMWAQGGRGGYSPATGGSSSGVSGTVLSVFGRTPVVTAQIGDYTAAQVTNAVDSTQTYSNPAWITGLNWSKILSPPSFPAASSVLPVIDGTATIGISTNYARQDHVHPTDTTRAPTTGSTSITTLGIVVTGTWNGTALTSAYIPATVVYTGQANTFGAGFKQSVQASATTAGINFGGVSADPSSLATGDSWFRTDLKQMSFYDGTATQRLAKLGANAFVGNQSISLAGAQSSVNGGGSTSSYLAEWVADNTYFSRNLHYSGGWLFGNAGQGYSMIEFLTNGTMQFFAKSTGSGTPLQDMQLLNGGMLELSTSSGNAPRGFTQTNVWNDLNGGNITLRHARGTLGGTLLALNANDSLGAISFDGFNGAIFPGHSAVFQSWAAENWASPSNMGAYVTLQIAPIASGSNPVEVIRFQQSGGISIGNQTFNGTDPGTGNLSVQGTIQGGVSATDPGCTTTAHIGKQWFNTTTTTTVYQVCLNVAGTVGWVTK